MEPKALVIRTAGTNCDMETVYALKTAGAAVALEHINHLKTRRSLSSYRILAIPGVAGYKDSSGDLAAFRAVLEHFGSRPDLSLLVGPDELTGEAVMLGADGGVNGGANLNPRLFADLYDAAERKDAAKVAELQARVLEQGKLYGTPVTTPGVIRAMKREAARMGLCRNVLAVPALPLQ